MRLLTKKVIIFVTHIFLCVKHQKNYDSIICLITRSYFYVGLYEFFRIEIFVFLNHSKSEIK